ncbi:acyl-CoA desaturase [Spirosoma flavus]
MLIVAFFLGHWYLSVLMQTFFLHRYAAHQMFTMSRGWEKFFYVLTFISQGSSFLSPRAYGIMHRLHHAHADTEHDPHSPEFSKNLFDMMWKTRLYYNDILNNRDSIAAKFKKGVPNWAWMEWFGDRWLVRLGWIAIYTAIYVAFAPSLWWFLLLPIHFLMGPVHGAIINWYAHRYGYTNFVVNDTAKNLLPFDFLMMGESYHNNHHKFGGRPNFGGFRWHEFDPAYPMIRLLDKLGVIQLRTGRDEAYM